MSVRIQLRRDTAANWTATNPTLTQGEPGYETDTGKIKYGDGTTAWSSLAYAPAAAVIDGTIVNADINASAAIEGTKISPNFGSQNCTSTGTSTAASFIPTSSTAPTNGLYLPSANSVGISAGGSGGLFLDSTGAVTCISTISDVAGNVRGIPQNAKTAAYTLVASDAGKHISITTGGATVPPGVFSVGNVITIYNNSTSNQTITQGASVTLRQAGTANTGNRTLAQYGVATLLCVGINAFVISGAGLS